MYKKYLIIDNVNHIQFLSYYLAWFSVFDRLDAMQIMSIFLKSWEQTNKTRVLNVILRLIIFTDHCLNYSISTSTNPSYNVSSSSGYFCRILFTTHCGITTLLLLPRGFPLNTSPKILLYAKFLFRLLVNGVDKYFSRSYCDLMFEAAT